MAKYRVLNPTRLYDLGGGWHENETVEVDDSIVETALTLNAIEPVKTRGAKAPDSSPKTTQAATVRAKNE